MYEASLKEGCGRLSTRSSAQWMALFLLLLGCFTGLHLGLNSLLVQPMSASKQAVMHRLLCLQE